MSTARPAVTSRHLVVTVLLLALLGASLPGVAVGAPAAEWRGYVQADPMEVRPDVAPPRVELRAVPEDDERRGLFVPGATVTVVDWDHGQNPRPISSPLPLDVTDGRRASFVPPALPAGDHVLEIASGGTVSRTSFGVRDPSPGHRIWFRHDDVVAGAREVSLTATGAYLDDSVRVTEVVRFRDGQPVAGAASGVRFVLDDAARGRLVFTDPLQADEEVHVTFADDQGFLYGDLHLWALPPSAHLRTERLLTGSTRGAELIVDPYGFAFDGSATVRLRTYGRPLPTGTLGNPTVEGDGSLRVPVTADLAAGWYELQVTAGGQRHELFLEVGPAGVEPWSDDLVRNDADGLALFGFDGLGQRWDASTTVTLRHGTSTVSTAIGLRLRGTGDYQRLSGAMSLPAGLAGIRTLRVTTGDRHVDVPVRVSGPKLWVGGQIDSGGGEVELQPDGFDLLAGARLTVRTDTGRTVLDTTLAAAEASGAWVVRPLSGAANVGVLTATVTQSGTSYTGRSFNGWGGGDLEVSPDSSPARSRPTSLDLRPTAGTFGPHLLSWTERWTPTTFETLTTPLPTRVGDRLARQSYPGGLADGSYDVILGDGDLTWFGFADVGDDEWLPNLEVVPYQHPSGTGAGKVLTVKSTDFPFAAGTTASLFDEEGDEVPGGVRAVQVVDQRTLKVTLGARLADGYHAFEVDVNGGYDYAEFLVGQDAGYEPAGPTWATNASLSVSNLAATSLTLSWPAASSDAGPVTYTVHRGSTKVAGPTTSRTATITGLTADTPYTFSVRATDARGVTSERTLQVTTRTRPGVATPIDPPRCRDAQPASFSDVPATYTHAKAVSCAAGHGLVLGRTATTFDPGGTSTRGQLASILLRSLERSGVQLTAEKGGFRDIAGSPHETAIRKLSAAGVIAGKSDTVFDPQGTVTRGQLMTLLDRASKLLVEPYPEVSGPRFSDTAGSPHAGPIDRLNAAGIAQGQSGGRTFGPSLAVNRGQAASFVTRWLEDQAARKAR
jgi:hypothetical protein